MNWRVIFRIAWREMRSARSRTLAAMLAVAAGVGAMSAVRGVGSEFRQRLKGDSRQWIAADVAVLIDETPSEPQWTAIRELEARGAVQTLVSETLTMASSDGVPDPAIVSIKAIDPRRYPFYGTVTTDPPVRLADTLDAGSAAVSPEVLSRMNARIGDVLRVNRTAYRIAAVVTAEPDRFAGSANTLMRIILTQAGLSRSSLLQQGNSAGHRLLLKLPAGEDAAAVRTRLERVFPEAEVVDYHDPDPKSSDSFDLAITYLNLAAWLAMALGAVAIAMTMYLHIQERLDTVAVLKVLGARQRQIAAIYLVQAALSAVAGGIAGICASAGLQRVLVSLVERHLAARLAVAWEWTPALEALGLGVCAALAATAGPILRARCESPGRLWRRYQVEDGGHRRHTWIWIGVAITGMAGLAAWLVESWRMGAYLLVGLTVAGGMLVIAVSASLWCVRRWVRTGPAPLRLSVRGLDRPGNHSRIMVQALAAGVMVLTASWLCQRSVSKAVVDSLPLPGAGLYLIGAGAEQIEGVTRVLASHPAVHGPVQSAKLTLLRLASVNGESLHTLGRRGVYKSWFATCDGRPGSPVADVTLTEESAARMGVQAGSLLEFASRSRRIPARVDALRPAGTVEDIWFGLTFPCSAFDGLPVFYHAGVHVDPAHVAQVKRTIEAHYPAVALLSRMELHGLIQDVADRALAMVKVLSLLVLAVGAIVMAIMVAAAKRLRQAEIAVLKAIGARRRTLAALDLLEHGIVGLLAGGTGVALGGALAAFLLSVTLRRRVAPVEGSLVIVAVSVTLSIALAAAAGSLASVRSWKRRPLEILRDE